MHLTRTLNHGCLVCCSAKSDRSKTPSVEPSYTITHLVLPLVFQWAWNKRNGHTTNSLPSWQGGGTLHGSFIQEKSGTELFNNISPSSILVTGLSSPKSQHRHTPVSCLHKWLHWFKCTRIELFWMALEWTERFFWVENIVHACKKSQAPRVKRASAMAVPTPCHPCCIIPM